MFDIIWMIALCIIYRLASVQLDTRYVNFLVDSRGISVIIAIFILYNALMSAFLTQKHNLDDVRKILIYRNFSPTSTTPPSPIRSDK